VKRNFDGRVNHNNIAIFNGIIIHQYSKKYEFKNIDRIDSEMMGPCAETRVLNYSSCTCTLISGALHTNATKITLYCKFSGCSVL